MIDYRPDGWYALQPLPRDPKDHGGVLILGQRDDRIPNVIGAAMQPDAQWSRLQELGWVVRPRDRSGMP